MELDQVHNSYSKLVEHVDNQPVGGHHQPPLKQAVQGQEKTSLFGEKEKGSTLVIVNFVVKRIQPGW